MIIWIDVQLPPALANWINSNFDVEAMSLKYL
jgi:predicted nuclease of predicted toxin-antitoxin system